MNNQGDFSHNSPQLAHFRVRPGVPILGLVLVLTGLHVQESRATDYWCPGGCVANVVFLGQDPVEWNFQVKMHIGGFEQISPTIRRAPVISNELTKADPGVNMDVRGDPPSYFYLVSQDPEGDPFFPANSHGDYYFTMEVPEVFLTLENEEPMIVVASDLPKWPPDAPFDYVLQSSTDFTDDIENTVTIESGTVTIVEDLIPTVSEWGIVVMALLVLAAGTVVIHRRRAMAARG